MLTLAFPAALGLLAALVPVALFYFLRMRFRRQPVSSTYLWERLIQTTEGGARLRWRSVLLFVLQLLAVVALVLALVGLAWVFQDRSVPGTVYILDKSASMEGRWEAAQGLLRAEAAARAPGSPAAFFLAGAEATEVSGSPGPGTRAAGESFDEAAVAATLQTWTQTHPGRWSAVLVTDGGLDLGGTRLAAVFGGRLRVVPVADPVPNVGLQALRMEGAPQLQARVTLFNGFAAPKTLHLVLSRNGHPLARREVTFAPGITSLTWPLGQETQAPGVYRVVLDGWKDGLATDNSFAFVVNPPRRARVLAVGPLDPFLRAALSTSTLAAATSVVPPGAFDLAVVTGDELPVGWSGNLVSFGPLPPDAPVFWGPEVSGPVTAASSDALGRWVPWAEVQAKTARGLGTKPGAVVLAEAGGWPVAITWEKGGSRFLVLGIDAAGSNLGLTGVLPVLLKNFRQACVPQEDNPLADNLRVGVPSVRAGTPAWRVEGAVTAVRQGGLWRLTAREPGVFRWTDGAESGWIAAQVPAAESDTAPRALASPAGASQEPEVRSQTVGLTLVPLAAVLILLAAEWRLWNGRFTFRPNRGLGSLRVGALAACALALTGLSVPWPTSDRNLVLVLDTSDSLGPDLVAQERDSALALLSRLGDHDRAALVAFDGQPRVMTGLVPRDQARATLEAASLAPGPHAQATDIHAALAAGAELVRGQPGSPDLVLFSDGRANQGGPLERWEGLPGIPVSAVPLGRPLTGLAVQGLEVPPTARPDEPVTVRWSAWSDQDRRVALTLVADGRPVETQTVTLTPGTTTASFALKAGAPGTRQLEVRVAEDGRPLDSARTTASLPVAGPASVLVVSEGGSPALPAALARQGFSVQTGHPAQLPNTLTGYQGLAAVVLDNVPAPSLGDAQQKRLQEWVASGGGLLVVGGDRTLGRGEYFSSVLEDLLPVQTDSRQRVQFTRSRFLFVVDHSGSMSEAVGDTTKLGAALQGIDQSLDDLASLDEVGLLEFDTEATWVLPFTPASRKADIRAALGRFGDGGGTDMTKALDEVLKAFGRPGPVKRHVVLLTDGQTDKADAFFQTFAQSLRDAQVSLTILGIGAEINTKLLGDLAAQTDGLFYPVSGADIPGVLHKETVRVTRDLVAEGNFVPETVGRDPLHDVGGDLPPVRGYLVTRPKPLARVLWRLPGKDADPLYADGRYGAGRVAVFTSDSGTRWLGAWSGLPVYNRFWGQAVRSLESPDRDKSLRLQMSVDASTAHLSVEALDQGRLKSGAQLVGTHRGQTFAFREVAPGRYEADVPLDTPGTQEFTVVESGGPGRTFGTAWNPTGTELARGGANWAGLDRLASRTGGLLQPLADPQPPARRWSWSMTDLGPWWLGLALVVFLAELAWRSLSLGQLAQAWALFLAWWADQAKPWKPRSAAVRGAAEEERRTQRAYRALAARRTKP